MCYYTLSHFADDLGRSPFQKWFDGLEATEAARITVELLKMEQGNFSKAKSIGGGVWEYRMQNGPGYRIYYAKHGERLILLLGGGTKRRQSKDIEEAKARWKEYKQHKRKER